jgi:hypothetical protein
MKLHFPIFLAAFCGLLVAGASAQTSTAVAYQILSITLSGLVPKLDGRPRH